MTAESAARELAEQIILGRIPTLELEDAITATLKRCRNEALEEAANAIEREHGIPYVMAGPDSPLEYAKHYRAVIALKEPEHE